MPTLPNSGFRPWAYGPSLIRRTAVCGPACTVVWQGRVGDHFPYADTEEPPDYWRTMASIVLIDRAIDSMTMSALEPSVIVSVCGSCHKRAVGTSQMASIA